MSKRRFFAALIAALGIFAFQFTNTAPAQAQSGWIEKNAYISVGGGNHRMYVEAWYDNYGCGLADCAAGGWLDGITQTYSGTKGNLNRVREGISFEGVSLSVSVDTGGGGVGFSDLGNSCAAAEYSYGTSYSGYARSYTGDWVCHASTFGWISKMTASNTGGVRYSSTWYNKTASAPVQLGL